MDYSSKVTMKNRSGLLWRILTFPLTKIITAIILVNVITFTFRSFAEYLLYSFKIGNEICSNLILFAVRSLTVYFMYMLFVKYIEKRKATELAIDKSALRDLSYGGLLGLACIIAVMSVIWGLSYYSIIGKNPWGVLLPSITYHFFFAYLQDIVYFGIVFRITEEKLGTWMAIAVASVIFGFKHLLFPEGTLWGAVAISVEAGILFSSLYIIKRRLWAIIGFHFIWNFVQFGILGIPHRDMTPLFISRFNGPIIITGGKVGIDSSIITCVIGLVLGLYFLKKAHKKGNFILPFWKKEPDIS
jgi:membrane protease YdiL (CAAX protease family)